MYQSFRSRTIEKDYVSVSADEINGISEYLIAKTETEEELEELVNIQKDEQDARKLAWKMAYKDVPIPMGYIPLDIRREMQIKRDELAEMYYLQIMSEKKYQ